MTRTLEGGGDLVACHLVEVVALQVIMLVHSVMQVLEQGLMRAADKRQELILGPTFIEIVLR